MDNLIERLDAITASGLGENLVSLRTLSERTVCNPAQELGSAVTRLFERLQQEEWLKDIPSHARVAGSGGSKRKNPDQEKRMAYFGQRVPNSCGAKRRLESPV